LDSGWASWLHASLERYRPPKPLIGTVTGRGAVPKRLAPIFRDRDELASATDLGTLINAALADSDCQVVICSPSAAKSRYRSAISCRQRLARTRCSFTARRAFHRMSSRRTRRRGL
jgi:hypothetical protein